MPEKCDINKLLDYSIYSIDMNTFGCNNRRLTSGFYTISKGNDRFAIIDSNGTVVSEPYVTYASPICDKDLNIPVCRGGEYNVLNLKTGEYRFKNWYRSIIFSNDLNGDHTIWSVLVKGGDWYDIDINEKLCNRQVVWS